MCVNAIETLRNIELQKSAIFLLAPMVPVRLVKLVNITIVFINKERANILILFVPLLNCCFVLSEVLVMRSIFVVNESRDVSWTPDRERTSITQVNNGFLTSIVKVDNLELASRMRD